MIRNILFTDKANFTRDEVNETRNSHLWDRDNSHWTVETNYQHRFSVNVWCDVIGDQLIVPYIFLYRLTGEIYANVLQDELPETLENVPLQIRRQMCYQHDGAPPHFGQIVRQYLNHKFPNRWIGRGGEKNWLPRSPDLNPLDYHTWVYMKGMLCAHKVNTREELLQRILSAARSIHNTAVLRKFTSSVVTRVRKCIQADGGHFEQFAWVLNGEYVTVYLTIYLNKCTMLLLIHNLFTVLKKSYLLKDCQLDPWVYDFLTQNQLWNKIANYWR